MQVQTRSDSNGKWSGIKYWDDVAAAYKAWTEDQTIWKISWSVDDKNTLRRRFCWTRPYEVSQTTLDERLTLLSSDYATAKTTAPNAVFWYHQDPLTGEIEDVLRDVDFRNKYCLDEKVTS